MDRPILPALNGSIAKVWLLQNLSAFDDHSASVLESFLESNSDENVLEGELRNVIHQRHGLVKYFIIALNNDRRSIVLRGYVQNDKIYELDKCSEGLGIFSSKTIDILRSKIPSLISKMTPNLEGISHLPTHFAPLHEKTSLNLDLADFDVLRGILLNTDQSEKLSSTLMNLLDLHPDIFSNLNA